MSKGQSVPAWLPDWTKPEQYPDPKNASLEQWAWEFLRRNPEYQEDYVRVKDMPGHDEYGKYKSQSIFSNFYKTEPPMKKDELFNDYINRVGESYTVWAIRDEILDKYGLDHFCKEINPATNIPPQFSNDIYPLYAPKRTKKKAGASLEQVYPDEIVMVFSLSLNIKQQLEVAKNVLNIRKSELKAIGLIEVPERRRTQIYRQYLRILDAKLIGITEEMIKNCLFKLDEEIEIEPQDKSTSIINENYKSAVRLRDSGYKYLLNIVYI